jgi:hypothetical protein
MAHHFGDGLHAGKEVDVFDQQSYAEVIAALVAIVLVVQEILVAKEETVEDAHRVIDGEGVQESEFEIQPG